VVVGPLMRTFLRAGARIAALILCLISATATAQVQAIPERKVDPPQAVPTMPQPGQLKRPDPVVGPVRMPPAVAIIRYYDPETGRSSDVYQGNPIYVKLEFTNLPPGEVNVDVSASRNPGNSVWTREDLTPNSLTSFSTPRRVGQDGTLTLETYVTFSLGPVLPTGGSPLHMAVVYADRSKPRVEVSTRPLPVIGMKVHTAGLPAHIVELGDFGGWTYGTGSRDRGWGCSAPGTRFSRQDVGVFADGGKMRIRTRSGPLGTYCPWETHKRIGLRYPWRVTAIRFGSSSSDTTRCWVQSPVRQMYFSHGRDADTISMIPGRVALGYGNEGLGSVPRMVGVTECTNTLVDDQFVELRWDNIELLGPVNGNPADAWPFPLP